MLVFNISFKIRPNPALSSTVIKYSRDLKSENIWLPLHNNLDSIYDGHNNHFCMQTFSLSLPFFL